MLCFKCNSIKVYKINDRVNKFLLAGDNALNAFKTTLFI